MKQILWLDDTRNPTEESWGDWIYLYSKIPKPYTVNWVKSYAEFVTYITTNGLPDGICFDHDLGMIVALEARKNGMSKQKSRKLKQFEKTGYDCAKWLIDYCIDNKVKIPDYAVQSANSVGAKNIIELLEGFKNRTNDKSKEKETK